jgi:hypothetical protein
LQSLKKEEIDMSVWDFYSCSEINCKTHKKPKNVYRRREGRCWPGKNGELGEKVSNYDENELEEKVSNSEENELEDLEEESFQESLGRIVQTTSSSSLARMALALGSRQLGNRQLGS